MKPRDGCQRAVDRQLDHQCDKLAVNARPSQVLSTEMTDDGAVYHTQREPHTNIFQPTT